jgi:hypothetical protein
MIQVRFDEQSRSRLVLIWEDEGRERAPETTEHVPEADGRAAGLLFSILGRNSDSQADAPAPLQPRLAKPKAPRRRKPGVRTSRPH